MTLDHQASRISVLLITYNHAKYLVRSVESILAQQIDEPFEIVLADDGSTDDTVAIVGRFAEQNPHITFIFLDYSTNRGITRNYQRAFAACRGHYVAIMEGDDYWVSPYKLARQRDFLDAHWECNLCSVNYFVYEEDRCQFTPRTALGIGHFFLGARELIADNLVGNFSTCMYRRSALEQLPPKVFDIDSYDWAINICIARMGLIGFLQEPMSVYRIHRDGAWNMLSHIEKLNAQLELIPAYEALTDGVFNHEFTVLADRLRSAITESQVNHFVAPVAAAAVRSAPKISDLMPPIVVTLAKLLLPPAVKRYLVRRLTSGQV